MKISFLSIGIEVAEAIVEVFNSEASPDTPRSEPAGMRAVSLIPQGFRAEVMVIFEAPDKQETLLADALQRVRARGSGGQLGETLSPLLTETGRLGLKAVLARSALLALPALALLVAPTVARVALPAARRNASLRGWVSGLLPAHQPRLPPAA
jgi:hypothetical protein